MVEVKSDGLHIDNRFVCRICGNNSYYSYYDTYYCSSCSVVFKNPYIFTLPNINIKLLSNDAILPIRAKDGDVGYDLFSIENITLYPGIVEMVHTGVSIELPKNTEAQIRSRSGMGYKGIIITNSPGTIDTGYRGEICVLMLNTTNKPYDIFISDKIAQMLITTKLPYEFKIVDELTETERGNDGFNSTGR